MKRLILCLLAVSAITFTSCKNDASDKVKAENVENAKQRDAQDVVYPTLDFEETDYDFGTIDQDEVVDHTFQFTNNGKAPLVITNARGSCGCTVPSYTREPIAPGETGELLVKFNPRGKRNQQNKSITVSANIEKGRKVLQIKAFVNPSTGQANSGSPIQIKKQ